MSTQLMQVVSVTLQGGKPKVEKVGKPMPTERARAMRDALNEKEIAKDLDCNLIVSFDAIKVEDLPTFIETFS